MPALLRHYRIDGDAEKGINSPFRPDSDSGAFGIFHKQDGAWNWKDFVTGEFGDEIDFIRLYENRSKEDSIIKFLEVAEVAHPSMKKTSAPISRRVLAPAAPAAPAEARPPKSAPAPAPFDWQKCVDAAKSKLAQVADWRGISPEFLEALRGEGLIGLFQPWLQGAPPAVAFPVHDADGKVIGCHYRLDAHNAALFTESQKRRGKDWNYKEGDWMYSKGAKTAPLLIGDPKAAADVFIFESQWDALAVADKLGWHTWHEEGRRNVAFVVTRGSGNGALVDGLLNPDARVTVWPQNDKPGKDGTIPSEAWFAAVTEAAKGITLQRVEIPKEHKDANDWIKAGVEDKTLLEAIAGAKDISLSGITISSFRSLLAFDPKNDPNCILGNRWICRTGSALWIGQSGIGKSSLMVQAAIMWALDRDLFGIKPARSLRSLIIQAENDEGDIAEMLQGVIKALSALWPNAVNDILEILEKQIIFVRDTIHTSADFAKVSGKLIQRFKPDLVWGDPLLSYAGDDISQQKVASTFLRNYLNPVAFDTGIAWMMLHHTGKPNADAKARSHWKDNDHSYVGLGSSELTNWARAVNVLATSAHNEIYKLMLPKRGNRAGMRDLNGDFTTSAHLQHAEYPQIYWNQVEEPDAPPRASKTGQFRQKYQIDDILKQMSVITPIKTSDLQKQCLEEMGISKMSFYRLWGAIKTKGLVQILDEGWVRK